MRILPRGPSNSMKHSDKPTAWGGTSPKKVAGVAAARTLRGADANIRLSLAYSRRKTLAVWNTPCSRATSAAEVAREHGVFQTAKVLRLEYAKLKRMVASAPRNVRAAATPTTFLELVPPQAVGLSECFIELEGPRGKIRIQWKGATAPDLAGLSRALWEGCLNVFGI